MPWTTEMVEKHKKGLDPSQKKKWVRIANGLLKNCMKDGGKNCEAMAIKVANEQCTKTKRMM